MLSQTLILLRKFRRYVVTNKVTLLVSSTGTSVTSGVPVCWSAWYLWSTARMVWCGDTVRCPTNTVTFMA